jgi:hypothetical protein
MKKTFQYPPWLVEYTAEDGARLDRLAFDNYDLLTNVPKSFHSPTADYGEYEKRPVYGYDDCFPSVEPCLYPGSDWRIPDHGELCWLKWKVSQKSNGLVFVVKSQALPLQFTRQMLFSKSGINWVFEVLNEGDKELPFQHVIHPLMPLNEVVDIDLPNFQSVYNATTNSMMELKNPAEVKTFLLKQPIGVTNMLFLQRVRNGKLSLTFKNGIRLEMIFPEKRFPTVGIWWNNSAYPDEDGCRRNECAFEPISGLNSALSDAYKHNLHLSVAPKEKYTWQIQWKMYR